MTPDDKVHVGLLPQRTPPATDLSVVSFAIGTPLHEVEREMMLRTLAHFHGDKNKAAQALGISVKTVYNHLTRYHEPQGSPENRSVVAPAAGTDTR
jgi:DNA-binding NtrC family response regulator